MTPRMIGRVTICKRADSTWPFSDLANRRWQLHDVIRDVTYDRDGSDLAAGGLYLDEPPWKASIFALTKRDEETEVPR